MTNPQTSSEFSKSKPLVFFEYIGLGLCLCVIALRVTFTEGVVQSSTQLISLGDNVYSLLMSGLLITFFIVWFILNVFSRRFIYRTSAIEIGLLLFFAGAIISGFAASDKRAAITNISTLTAPVLMCILLVQILDSLSKIKLILCFVVGLGAVSAYQSSSQFFVSNRLTIEQYEENPKNMLAPLGVREGSFEHMLFEHRIYSKGVSGFFTNSNSPGSSAMLAFICGVGLALSKFKNRKSSGLDARGLIGSVVVVAGVLGGLFLTQSKGAIAASVVAAVMFVCYSLFGKWLKTHKVTLLIMGLVIFSILCCVVISYGLEHDRLPGGNSMLVRWQYWNSSVRMYADHWYSGVGPGNFGVFYPHYKDGAAIEVVADPHNFVLSILTQYGPVGLLGFLVMIFGGFCRVVFGRRAEADAGCEVGHRFRGEKTVFLVIVGLVLFCVRPILLQIPTIEDVGVMIYIVFTLYATVVIVLVVGVLLLTMREKSGAMDIDIVRGAIFCGLLSLLIHNLIDFAIFEVGVLTSFWAVFACLIALDNCQRTRGTVVVKVPGSAKLLLCGIGVGVIFVYFNYAFVPVKRSVAKIQQALSQVNIELSHDFLYEAGNLDTLDSGTFNLNGRGYLEHYMQTSQSEPILLEKAAERFLWAVERNRADYKNYSKLCRVYELLGEPEKAYSWCVGAVRRYPGSGKLHAGLAKTAEQLGKTEAAIEHYKKAIEIEDAYRSQFKVMYPGREVFSRIGEEEYHFAIKRLEELTENQLSN